MKDVLIQRQGDWKSQTYRGYIDLTPEQQCEASTQMFQFLDSGAEYVLYEALEPIQHVVHPSEHNYDAVPPPEEVEGVTYDDINVVMH